MNTENPEKRTSVYFYSTIIGNVAIESLENFIVGLYLPGTHYKLCLCHREETEVIAEARQQLVEYLGANRREFDLRFRLDGTEFQRLLLKTLLSIPYGETRSYSQLATAMGRKSAARAVGAACNRNPIPIFIPCHRVIGSRGDLTGYSGGLELKQKLLNLEKSKVC
jgi:methylated-DNA-[protein]-cysteine S-methyltransferase